MKERIPPFMHQDEIGDEHGRLTIISESFLLQLKKRKRHHVCQCICGKIVIVDRYNLLSGNTFSCGCYKAELCVERGQEQFTEHGYRSKGHPLKLTYRVWEGMISRCVNCHPGYETIDICARWISEDGFENFLADMGPRPSIEYSIDRVDPDGDYCPENCQWLLKSENVKGKGR